MTGNSTYSRQISNKMKHLSRCKDILIVGEPGTGKRYLAHSIHLKRTGKGPYILLDGFSATHAEVQAVLYGNGKDLVRLRTGHDPARLSHHATVCIANADAFGPQEQDLLTTFLRKHRADHTGLHIILTANDLKKVAVGVGSFERVDIPPLRKRLEDIPALVQSILQAYGKGSLAVDERVVKVLQKGSWVENISELAKVVGKGALISEGNTMSLPEDYLDEHQHLEQAIENIVAGRSFDLDKTLWLLEKLLIERVLKETRNNQSHAAAAIALSEANFRYRLKKFGIPSVRTID